MTTNDDGKVKAYADITITAPLPGMIYNQDGLGFSGVIAANPLGSSISMTGYDSWPSGTSNIEYTFSAGGDADGSGEDKLPTRWDRKRNCGIYGCGIESFEFER